jgi:hypothetical protein
MEQWRANATTLNYQIYPPRNRTTAALRCHPCDLLSDISPMTHPLFCYVSSDMQDSRSLVSSPAWEAGGLYYSRVLRYFERGSFFARLACVLGRYGTYGDFGILIKKNAPAFRASSAPFISSHREMHSFVFSGLGQEQLCTVTQMRAIFAQFVHSRSVDRWEESRKLQ